MAGIAPCAIALTFRTLVQVAPITLPKGGNIGVTSQEMLARLFPNRKSLFALHRFCLR
jgi:hypothetical protein